MRSSQWSSVHMDKYYCWSTSKFHSWFIFVFNLYKYLSEGLSTNAKLLADDTSLFSVIHDSQTSANDLVKDLEMIHNWDFHWKMNFKPDHTKQAQEAIFS